jgi:hypothetical protein
MEEQTLPPERPLWDGIYDYIWNSDNGKSVFITAFCFFFLAPLVCGFHALLALMRATDAGTFGIGFFDIAVTAGSRIFAALVVLTFLFSIFPCACFVRIIESTAAGEDRIHWSQGVWFDFLKDLLYLFWIFACSAAVPVLLLVIADQVSPISSTLWWMGSVGGAMLFLPLFLLSTMMGNAPWMLIHVRVLTQFLQQPVVPAVMYLNIAAFAAPSLLLGYWMTTEHYGWFPLTGIVWWIYWIALARLLGRVGWILTQEGSQARGETRRRKVQLREAAD